MSGFWADLKKRGIDYRTRFLLMRNVLEKIKENNVIVPTTAEVTLYKKRIYWGTIGISIVTLLAAWRTKKFFNKSMVLGVGFAGITVGIKPYYVAEMIDSLAETQTEAGQIIRATFLFKIPNHPDKERYERLSAEYRAFAAQKRKELSHAPTS
jgi:hypothetical protein